jgi:hypothetical protein
MCLLQVLSFLSFLWSLALVASFYWFWGSDDPILCTLYPYTKILYNAQIMGSFSSFFRILIWSYHKIFWLLVFNWYFFDLLHLLWVSIGFGGAMILFCALCIHIQKFFIVHKSWGASLASLEHSFALLIISFSLVASRVTWSLASFGISWLLASRLDMPLCHIIFIWQSLDPQYSLSSSNYSSLDMCISLHSYFEKCTLYGGTHIILAF